MPRWYRVFARGESGPSPESIREHLRELDAVGQADFVGDAAGWYAAEVILGPAGTLRLERYGADEEGIGTELRRWAAWLECREDASHAGALLEHVVQSRQLFTLEAPDGSAESDRVCAGLCRFLAARADGVWQADGRGFFDAAGALLVPE
jgi:hypothetical protein